MLFKDIFDIYQTISNKVVGILARARKNRLIHFEGETLFQGENDATNITLLRSAKHIEVSPHISFIHSNRLDGLPFLFQDHFKNTKELLYNDEATGLYVIR